MRRLIHSLACTVFLTTIVPGCKIADDLLDLPDATQTGAHTFGCMVDGKRWTDYAEHTLDNAIEADFNPRYFTVRVENEIGDVPYIYFMIGDSTGIQEKTYPVGKGFNAIVSMGTDSIQNEELYTDQLPEPEGYVTITKIKQPGGTIKDKGILAGTFSFTARSATTSRIVKVTDGRFDFALY